jgi:hypothetical protein
MTPPFREGFDSRYVGIDPTKGRYGDVTVETCRACRRPWLRYHVVYESFSKSGRWFRALVSDEVARHVTPESAVSAIEAAEVRFAGGSYFDSTGFRHKGSINVDL